MFLHKINSAMGCCCRSSYGNNESRGKFYSFFFFHNPIFRSSADGVLRSAVHSVYAAQPRLVHDVPAQGYRKRFDRFQMLDKLFFRNVKSKKKNQYVEFVQLCVLRASSFGHTDNTVHVSSSDWIEVSAVNIFCEKQLSFGRKNGFQ